MSALERLVTLARADIAQASAAVAAGGSLRAWERAMQESITKAHTAAYLAATAQRLGISANSPLLAQNRLTRAERADIKAAIAAQMSYLQNFAAQVAAEEVSAAAIGPRAAMYGSSIRPFYYAQRWRGWKIPEELLPGNQACLTNCTCTVEVVEGAEAGEAILRRRLGPTEAHCSECPGLAGDHSISREEA